MTQDCSTNSCSIQESEKTNILSHIKSILTHPNSKCPTWNAFLIAIILVVFGQAIYCDFIFYDDFNYTVAKMDKGNIWTYSFLSWAFTSMDDGFWAPLTKISHRLDTHLFGVKAGGHHAVNLLFHIINSLILWRLLCKITKSDGFVQFLAVCVFAVHPLRVEPVVWIASRKDLLSSLFLFLMLIKYMDWIELRRKKDYLSTLFLFILSGMSKPVSMVFPLFLPLLDLYISKKENKIDTLRIVSYIPFFLISAFLAIFALHSEQEAIIPVSLSLGERISRIIVSTALYFLLSFLPTGLHIPFGTEYFPFFGWTKGIPVYNKIDIVIISSGLVFLFSVIWVTLKKQYKINIFSILLFLIPLLPVIGFIPFGDQLIADRFTYASHIGLCIFLCTIVSGYKTKIYAIFTTILVLIVVIFSVFTISYIQMWENREKLFRNCLKYEPNNYVALCNVGHALVEQSRYIEAIPHLQKAIEVYPFREGPYNDLAFSYQALGRYKDALKLYNKSLEISGDDPEILNNIAFLFYEMGNYEMSRKYAERALQVKPDLVNSKKLLEMLKGK